MKKNLLIAVMSLSALAAFGQGQIQFKNLVTSGSGAQAAVIAPIYGVDPNNPTAEKHGNAASYPPNTSVTPIPAGTQTYGGQLLLGTGFTASLWAAKSTDADSALQLVGTSPFRTVAGQAGFWVSPASALVVNNVPSDPAVNAKFQVRVWDNKGGTVTSWDAVINNSANAGLARGWSDVFTLPFQLGGGTAQPPTLQGLQSFQLFTAVPEPSVIALGVLGAGCLFLLRRRK